MNWIEVKNQSDIPKVYYQDRERLLLQDVNGFIGVGYWNSYDWVLDTWIHDVEITFDKIVRYAEIKLLA